jgi:RimJ/RimL family protein N-acetyltransferase
VTADEAKTDVTGSFERQSIRGERVFLRSAEPEDAELVYRWHQDIALRRLGGDPPRSLARLRRRSAALLEEEGASVFSFLICRLDDGQPIGRMDLFEIDRLNGSAAVGVEIGERAMWGRGYGTDAVNALLDFAFAELRLERVWLGTASNNMRAQRSYAKSGFVEEARLRNAYTERGAMVDEVRMSILRDEWRALTRKRSWEYADDT